MTAYHETTLQPRATINLNKATKLIDDKTSLTQRETTTKGGGRRKSGFAEEDGGYMFVEEGFRIRFANGEVIDFYADTAAQKNEWMQALGQVVGKGIPSSSTTQVKGWADMVLRREKSMHMKSQAEAAAKKMQKEARSREQAIVTSDSAIPRPSSHVRTESFQRETAAGLRSQANSPTKSSVPRADRAMKARSMAF